MGEHDQLVLCIMQNFMPNQSKIYKFFCTYGTYKKNQPCAKLQAKTDRSGFSNVIIEHHIHLYANSFENVDESNKFLNAYTQLIC